MYIRFRMINKLSSDNNKWSGEKHSIDWKSNYLLHFNHQIKDLMVKVITILYV